MGVRDNGTTSLDPKKCGLFNSRQEFVSMIAIFALVHRDGRNVRDDHPGTTGVAVVVDDVSDEDEMIMEAKA